MLHVLGRQKKGVNRTTVILAVIFLITAAGLLFHFRYPKGLREDFRRISTESYDTVLLSMYPLDTYHAEDIEHYRSMAVMKASYCIPNLDFLERYLRCIEKSGNAVSTIYLGIWPGKADIQELQELISQYPQIVFEVILFSPSAVYWQSLSDEKYEEVLAAYCELLNAAPDITGANFYFMGFQEWLVSNPANYKTPYLTTDLISRIILAHSDTQHDYQVDAVTAEPFIQALTELTGNIRSVQEDFPDLSDCAVVLFGDSIFANREDASSFMTGEEQEPHGPYEDTTSISGVLSALTGAEVYNCGYGGNSAALGPEVRIALAGIVEAFFAGDLTAVPRDAQVYEGISDYMKNPPVHKKLCFVINYGLNDYFNGLPVASGDPYDIRTYSGAVRTAVKTIQENAPGAQIILCTPTLTGLGKYGENQNADGHVLKEYADAILSISRELYVDVLDNYNELGICRENILQYIGQDLVHPNYAGRYRIAKKLIALFR